MKRFIVLSISFLILISNSLIAQKIDTKILIGHTYKIKNYKSRYEKTFINVELAEHDFPNDIPFQNDNIFRESTFCFLEISINGGEVVRRKLVMK